MSEGANPYAVPVGAAPQSREPRSIGSTFGDVGETIEVECEVIRDDLLALAEFEVRRRRVSRSPTLRTLTVLQVVLLYLVVIPPMMQVSLAQGGDPFTDPWTWSAFVLVTFLVGVLPIVRRRGELREFRLEVESKPHNPAVGRHRLTVSPSALENRSVDARSWLAWRCIERIEITDVAAYLYVMSGAIHLIPRRGVSSDAEFDAFVALARKYQEAAQGG